MLRTITLGSCVSVQGHVVRHTADGRLVIRVDEREFVGLPVAAFREPVQAVPVPPETPAGPPVLAAVEG